MAISDSKEEILTENISSYLVSDSFGNETKVPDDALNSMLHQRCFTFENGSMLVPLSYFPRDQNGSIMVPPNITTMEPNLSTGDNSSILTEKMPRIDTNALYLGDCWKQSSCYYINCSSWGGPPQLSVPIYGYIMPLIFVITLLSNIMIILILSKRHMLSPTNLVLKAMAISDLLTVIFPFPWHFYIYTLGYDNSNFSRWEMGFTYEMMLETLPQIFHTASIWLTLALAMQRYIYVCHALAARSWCTMDRTRRAVALIFLFAFLHQATRFFDKKFESVTVEYPICSGDLINICKVSFADWVIAISLNAYFITYYWFRVLFVHMLPCVALVILNILLFRAMREADRKRERLLKTRMVSTTTTNSTVTNDIKPVEGESKQTKKIRDTNDTTLMLVVVITVFLAVEVPMGVITTLHIISSSTTEFLDYSLVKAVILINNLFISMSYPLNFGIYCGMSKQFRDTFKELIPISCKPNNNNRNNGDIRAVTKHKGPGSHSRSKPHPNSKQGKQKEFVNLNKRKTSNDVDNNQTAAIPSITDKEKRDELRVSTFMMTQEFVTEKGICQNDPNVTTALLTDCPGMGEHEMSVLKPNENGNETTLTTKDASDAMNSINHTQVQLTHDGGCKPEKGQNGFHSQDDLVKVVTTGQPNVEHKLHISSPDPWDETNGKVQGNGHKNVNLPSPLKASSVATAHSSTMSSTSECRSNKNTENAFHKSFIPPANLAASTTIVNGRGNMASNLASADMRSNEEDIAIITAQQVTHETHL